MHFIPRLRTWFVLMRTTIIFMTSQMFKFACFTGSNKQHAHAIFLLSKTKVSMKKPSIAKNFYKKNPEHGMFKLFFSESIRDAIWDQTHFYFTRVSTHGITKIELETFLALEIFIGLCENNNVKDCWSKKEFSAEPIFPKYQSRRAHLKICSNI